MSRWLLYGVGGVVLVCLARSAIAMLEGLATVNLVLTVVYPEGNLMVHEAVWACIRLVYHVWESPQVLLMTRMGETALNAVVRRCWTTTTAPPTLTLAAVVAPVAAGTTLAKATARSRPRKPRTVTRIKAVAELS